MHRHLITKLSCALLIVSAFAAAIASRAAETVALWAFDEPAGLYPSSALSDQGPHEYFLAIGPGGSIVPGKFGRALSTIEQPIQPGAESRAELEKGQLVDSETDTGAVMFGLKQLATPAGRTVAPLSWMNAHFAALWTVGEKHLRKDKSAPNPTETGLNLGAFDWTVEFWFQPAAASGPAADGVVFEVGEGPRGENDHVTALRLKADRSGFTLLNQPAGVKLDIPSDAAALKNTGAWTHLAFVYDAAAQKLAHYVDGHAVGAPLAVRLQALPVGAEAYFSLGRDARWQAPLPGALDELRISRGRVYAANFTPPGSFVAEPNLGAPAVAPKITQPLLFASEPAPGEVTALGSRKYLMVDDSLFPSHQDVKFVPTPPLREELVYKVKGSFRKHTVVVDDGEGGIRLYAPIGKEDQLGVFVSKDGTHFETPTLPNGTKDNPNIATSFSAGTPSVFIDPLAPPAERWKLVSGDEWHGIFLAVSPDGYTWKRSPTAALSARSASQSNMIYDDQRGQYIGYHRSDMGRNVFGKTERRFVGTLVDNLKTPWPFHPLTGADYDRITATNRLNPMQPFYFDNGPLTPGGLGAEYPFIFAPRDGFDPAGVDLYVPKAVKYPWAPDVYLAFPCIYYHYESTEPETRSILGEKAHGRGSGPIETQLMTSRDGLNWKRYPRPVWQGVGLVDGYDIHQNYMAQGMVRRGDEIWMYSYNNEEYHSPFGKRQRQGIFRLVQRLDRFVAAEAAYDETGTMTSRPFTFTGRKLVLNVDTGAAGTIQVGLLRGDGMPIQGYGVDNCVFVNGNELRYEVEWLGKGTDLSKLAGQAVRLEVRLRGARLYSLQFEE
ncbi:MAG TPA: LamG domain-containing protein [Lacunisphaera sp.]|nr:LamG domain-containing protein [Lacunisphaera sp.]